MKITDKTHFTISTIEFKNRYDFNVYDCFFENEIVYKIFEDRIEFRKPTLDTRKRILKPHKTKFGTGHIFSIFLDFKINIENKSCNFEDIEDEDLRTYYFEKL
jgi:hypothetical protein